MSLVRRALCTAALAVSAPLVGAPTAGAATESCSEDRVYLEQRTPSYPYVALDGEHLAGIATGDGVTVAVVDSGVDPRNPHLRDAVTAGFSTLPGDGSKGRTDASGHGTSVAGVIAARPVAGSLMVGIAPRAEIMPVHVHAPDGQGSATTATIAAGVRWAAEHKAQVINISLSSGVDDPALREAVEFALRKDAVVVAAAGNQDSETEPDGLRYPAAYDGVIGVAATSVNGTVVQSASITGPQVAVTAPGAGVLTTYHANGDCLIGGGPYSSYAAGYVSGLAALLREKFPDELQERITYRILAGADGTQDGERDDVNGWGAIQPRQSLTMLVGPERPGPPLPGSKAAVATAAAPAKPVVTLGGGSKDPLQEARTSLVWWAILGTGGVAIALVTRPLLARSRRS